MKCNVLVKLIEDATSGQVVQRESQVSSSCEPSRTGPLQASSEEVEPMNISPDHEAEIATCISELCSTTPQAMNSTYAESDSDFAEESDGMTKIAMARQTPMIRTSEDSEIADYRPLDR